jgi:hypothetical protein
MRSGGGLGILPLDLSGPGVEPGPFCYPALPRLCEGPSAAASRRLDEFRRPERRAHMIVHAGLPETGDLIRRDVGGERNDRHLRRAPGGAGFTPEPSRGP